MSNIYQTDYERIKELERTLEFALQYVAKGTEQGVFDNTAITGKQAIKLINQVLLSEMVHNAQE